MVSFNGDSPDELLRIVACMEEHFPHSMAKAVVEAAREKGLDHEEMHSKVEYVVAHGISTTINGRKAVIGSYHLYLRMRELPFLRVRRNCSRACRRSIPICIWPSRDSLQP